VNAAVDEKTASGKKKELVHDDERIELEAE
jgi:hypothetical protein